ncbi:MAG: hypothetical protein K8J31_15445 [Anaerolineae bacterium]|nr:hypothetical protein [Anaerolineae bacterium]
MPIRYCTATSKRTKKPCRARAMCGRNVCYHHGGKSLRGVLHPNFRHGYYSKDSVVWLMLSIAFDEYRQALRKQQLDELLVRLDVEIPHRTKRDYRRFMAAYRATAAQLPRPRLTPELAAFLMRWRWPGWFGTPADRH